MILPVNFLYLGGDKCGSTWVHRILSQHPDVSLAHAKELFYFDRFYEKGPNWYKKQFPQNSQAARTGEVCHDYLYSDIALRRIARDLPDDSRFLITVRAPVERTVSHYKYLRKIGRTSASMAEALQSQPQIIEHSMFGKHVARAQAILGKDRVHVLPFELLKSDPPAFGRAMCNALAIRFHPNLPYENRVLEAQAARNPMVVRLLRNGGWALRRLGKPQIVSQVKTHPLVTKLLFDPNKQVQIPRLESNTLRDLATRFNEDQSLLAECVPDMWKSAS